MGAIRPESVSISAFPKKYHACLEQGDIKDPTKRTSGNETIDNNAEAQAAVEYCELNHPKLVKGLKQELMVRNFLNPKFTINILKCLDKKSKCQRLYRFLNIGDNAPRDRKITSDRESIRAMYAATMQNSPYKARLERFLNQHGYRTRETKEEIINEDSAISIEQLPKKAAAASSKKSTRDSRKKIKLSMRPRTKKAGVQRKNGSKISEAEMNSYSYRHARLTLFINNRLKNALLGAIKKANPPLKENQSIHLGITGGTAGIYFRENGKSYSKKYPPFINRRILDNTKVNIKGKAMSLRDWIEAAAYLLKIAQQIKPEDLLKRRESRLDFIWPAE